MDDISDRTYQCILAIHEKIDKLSAKVEDMKVKSAPIPWRIKVLELIVYGGVALILLASASEIIGKTKGEAKASQQKIGVVVNDKK